MLLEFNEQGITESNLSQEKWVEAEPNQEHGEKFEDF